MPNWCANRLRVSGPAADVDEFAAAVATSAAPLSLAALVPMPAQIAGAAAAPGDSLGALVERIARSLERPEQRRGGPIERALAHNQAFHGPATDWYAWAMINWGTKWDVADATRRSHPAPRGRKCLDYRFDSAWSPPVAWAVTASRRFPTLRLELLFFEAGNDFGGEVALVGGRFVADRVPLCQLASHSGGC
jgi:hypothetical protein